MKTKIFLTIALVLAAAIYANAQDEPKTMKTLFKKPNTPVHHGGYLGFTFGYTQIDNEDAVNLGGRIGWLINHHFTLGLAGYGYYNNLHKTNNSNPGEYAISGGYGGLFIEPIVRPFDPVHVSFPVIFGFGGVSAGDKDIWNDQNNYNNYNYDSDIYMVLEPGIDVEFNLLKYFKLAVGASYRLTNGVDLEYQYYEGTMPMSTTISKDVLDSFNVNMSLKFGLF